MIEGAVTGATSTPGADASSRGFVPDQLPGRAQGLHFFVYPLSYVVVAPAVAALFP